MTFDAVFERATVDLERPGDRVDGGVDGLVVVGVVHDERGRENTPT